MEIKCKGLLIFFLLVFSNTIFAENGCPDGMTPFQNGNDPSPKCYPVQGGQSTVSNQPRGHWQTRWGAIAIGSTASGGGVGVATDMLSKRQAEKAAMAQCKATGGGSKCAVSIRYFNQCAVIAWGDTGYATQGAENVKVAGQIALDACSKFSKNCKIFYSDCSLPVWGR